jgi:type IV fimbrial biogenesis protein FimT
VPSLREFLARQRVAAVNAELVTDLQFARSEAVARDTSVFVSFRFNDRVGSPPMTCYTIHTRKTAGVCDCRKPMGTSCPALPDLVEIKTVQVLRADNVTVQPFANAAPAYQVIFTGTKGLVVWGSHVDGPTYVSDWVDFSINVESTISGKLQTAVGITGRPQVCTPDGSFSGVPRCAE